MNDKERILGKIKKCMALGRSANEHEAAAAMRQWALIADMKGKSWADLDQAGSAQLIEQAADDEVPFDGCTSTSQGVTKKMTVGMWFQHRLAFTWDEFPWEERDPYDMALENFEKIEVAE